MADEQIKNETTLEQFTMVKMKSNRTSMWSKLYSLEYDALKIFDKKSLCLSIIIMAIDRESPD